VVNPQTDDWPYLYIKDRGIPNLHKVVTVLLLTIFTTIYLIFFGRPTSSDIHFAALGAGFLLLEVSVISCFALFWGTTWVVASIAISLILAAILIANWLYLSLKRPVDYKWLYLLIVGGLVVIYFTPLESNWLILLYLAPFTAIGFLFAKSFDSAALGSRALAFNLFGALVGGMSESLSFIIGISGLIPVAIGFYLISLIAIRVAR
jgi:hypothetical protein